MLQYKERGSNLDKYLSPYLSIIYQRPVKYSMEYSHLFIEWGTLVKLPLIFWFFVMAFNFGYASGHILERQDMRAV